ncbi:MAG: stage II sporulation protein D [Cytobacillus gottheilii]|uniref:stage II sporulation protein D n=1 Tax=Cytobacillus gottheilii TaxID=859144 RepID=UPI000836863B|nr:stage II sporulation protein D [Cytobacillus gottheilii]
MTKIKPFILLASILFAVTIIVPSLLVIPFSNNEETGKLDEELEETVAEPAGTEPAIEVAVFRTATKKVENLAMEDYLVGVVSAEMPAEFEDEALKAQALTARTYIVQHLMKDQDLNIPGDAQVYDTVDHQVYKNKEELKKQWKEEYDSNIKKVTEAVRATAGQILTYEGNPIQAQFFSTSNGFTENSESVWTNAIPYLKSVESPWDQKSPEFTDQLVIAVPDFEAKLGVSLPEGPAIGSVTERTAGKRVSKVNINGKELKGVDIREKLGLRSTDFTWERKGDNVVIQTKGYGHGVGMSQYGANGMAAEGKTYKEIVNHYYKGVEISTSDTMLAKVMAKK